MLKPEFSGQFKRDYKLAIKRGCDPKKLEEVITLLCNEQPLPEAYRDHALTNSRNYKDMRECHIEPDWLLVYMIWLMFRTVLALSPLGWFFDSIRSILPSANSILYSFCKSREVSLPSGMPPTWGLIWLLMQPL